MTDNTALLPSDAGGLLAPLLDTLSCGGDDLTIPAAIRADWSARVFSEMQTRAALYEALTELLEACEIDCGVPDEDDGDDEPVGGGEHGDMALTFGMLRRARAALAKAEPR